MTEFQPYFTNDGSVGLYSNCFDDIYHSASGALTEAYEKFIYPINWDILLMHDNIKILDLCYGIGYNTKSFLNYIFQNKKFFLKSKNFLNNNNNNSNLYIASIHTDNISELNKANYNDKIYTDNIFNKISITAVDKDEILFGLSLFIKTGVKNFLNDLDFIKKHKIDKYINKNNANFPKINNLINYQIFDKILSNYPEILKNPVVASILTDDKYINYINADFRHFYLEHIQNTPQAHKLSNLHNIYYRYLSFSYKMRLKQYKLQDFDINIKIDDARNVIKQDKNLYNLIFMDAFTHSKCPCLWSYDFLKKLYSLLDHDGMLLTYSSAPQVRSAMIEAGFFIGNIYNKRLNKYQGTICTKNKSLICYPLSEVELGLLNTKAGIFYRDEELNAQNEAILARHKIETKCSSKISSSQYLKLRRKNGL